MVQAQVEALIGHMYWANDRVLGAAELLSADEFVAPTDLTTRSLRETLVHELDVEWSWRLNLQGRSDEAPDELEPESFPDVASLRERWRQDEAEMRTWIGSLTEEQLVAPVYSAQTDETRPLWEFVVHVTNHATQQRADAATLLTLAGHSPGDFEFLDYLREVSP